jgi:hypothetical protein
LPTLFVRVAAALFLSFPFPCSWAFWTGMYAWVGWFVRFFFMFSLRFSQNGT